MTYGVTNGNVLHKKEGESLDRVVFFFSPPPEMAEEYFYHKEFSGMILIHYDF